MLFNLSFFLLIAAIIVAVTRPKSKLQVWLYSIVTPFLLSFIIAIAEAPFLNLNYNYSNRLAWSFGESVISIIVTIPTIFFCLKKKLVLGEKYKFPSGIITTIIVLFIIACILECSSYVRKKTLQKTNDAKIEVKG